MSFGYEKKNEVWRLFTYQFIHPDLESFLVSVTYQIGVGCPFEVVFGTKNVIFLQTFGVIMGKDKRAKLLSGATTQSNIIRLII